MKMQLQGGGDPKERIISACIEVLVLASPIYYHNISGQLKCAIDRFYAPLYPNKPESLKKAVMLLCSGDPDMYQGAVFSYQGDFLDYLGLEDGGVVTAAGAVTESKLKEARELGKQITNRSLK